MPAGKSSVATAEGKRRQRARNGTRSGSSGASFTVANIVKPDFAELEERLGDGILDGPEFVGEITDVRMMANRAMVITMVIPREFAQEALAAGQDSAAMFTWLSVRYVPRHLLLPPPPEDEDEDAAEGD